MDKHKKRSWSELPKPLAGPIIDNYTYLPVHKGGIPGADGLRLSLNEQLSRAKIAGIVGIIPSICEIPSFGPTMQIAHACGGVYVAVAIHPNEAAPHTGVTESSPDGLVPRQAAHHVLPDEMVAKVERLLKDPLVIATGKGSPDYFRTAAQGRGAWKRSSVVHLELGAEVDLPVQIHDRDAHTGTLKALASVVHAGQLIVLYCFSGDIHLARVLTEKSWYASFADPLTYPMNEDLRAALVIMPRELILVETDVPYSTPVPHRDSPSASYVMAHTVRFIAKLWGVSEEKACVQLMENTRCVYNTW